MIYGEMSVLSKYIQDTTAVVTQIIDEVQQIQFNMEFQLEKRHLTIRALYKINSNPYLMIQYNKEVTRVLKKYQNQLIASNIKYYRYYAII